MRTKVSKYTIAKGWWAGYQLMLSNPECGRELYISVQSFLIFQAWRVLVTHPYRVLSWAESQALRTSLDSLACWSAGLQTESKCVLWLWSRWILLIWRFLGTSCLPVNITRPGSRRSEGDVCAKNNRAYYIRKLKSHSAGTLRVWCRDYLGRYLLRYWPRTCPHNTGADRQVLFTPKPFQLTKKWYQWQDTH